MLVHLPNNFFKFTIQKITQFLLGVEKFVLFLIPRQPSHQILTISFNDNDFVLLGICVQVHDLVFFVFFQNIKLSLFFHQNTLADQSFSDFAQIPFNALPVSGATIAQSGNPAARLLRVRIQTFFLSAFFANKIFDFLASPRWSNRFSPSLRHAFVVVVHRSTWLILFPGFPNWD